MILGRHEKQAGPGFNRWLRSAAAGLEDTDDCSVGCDDANSNRSYHREAENQRHEERNQDQPPCPELDVEIAVFRCGHLNFAYAASSIYLR